jgi:cytochrome c oxidase subunit 3
MKQVPVLDIADLPAGGFDSRTVTWWGTLGFMTLEGTGFLLAIGALLYLYGINSSWPLSAPPPDLLPGTIVTLLLLFSLAPNHLLNRWAHERDLPRVRIGVTVMSLLGLLPLIVRWFEFPALNVQWDDNAYGSAIWFLLGLHTSHIVTDVADTLVLNVLMLTRKGATIRRLSDVTDNVFYWDFVVLAWLPIYFLIYWLPRLPV